jgi:hypothetical protein
MVACVNSAEVIFVHILYQLPVLLAQTATLILIPMFVFEIPFNGFWGWTVILTGLGGFSGLSLSKSYQKIITLSISRNFEINELNN